MSSTNQVHTEDQDEADEQEKMGSSTFDIISDEDDEEGDVNRGPIRRCLQKTWVRILVFIGLSGYGAFCVVFDWLWVNDMLNVEKALVFGPANSGTVIALIFVSSVGTIAYGWEIINNAMKLCNKDPIMDEDLAQVLVLFVEDVPQTILNVLLASCREMPISVYQLVKAGFGILGAALRVLFTLYHYFTPRRHGRQTGFFPWLIRTVILFATTCVFIGSCMVLIYTFTDPPTDGSDIGDFRPPLSIYDKSYDKGRYVYLSGVYFSHPSFAACNANNASWNDTSINWIKLEDLYGIMATSDDEGSAVTFYYDANTTYIRVDTQLKPEVCFMTDQLLQGSCNVTEMADCGTIPTTLDHIDMLLIHTDRTKTLVFGDIKVKATLTEGVACSELNLDDDGYLYDDDDAGDVPRAQIQYFKATPGTNETFTYMLQGNGTTQGFAHYQVGDDLDYVTDVWLTGYRKCEMSGSLRPNLDDELDLQC